MKKGGVIAMLAVAAAALVAANGVVYLSEDRTSPEIHFSNFRMTYTDGETDAELLKGVTADDNRDGDVTSSLRISSIIPNKKGTEVTVEYTAKDSSNNVQKVSRVYPYDGSGSVSDSAAEEDTAEENTDSEAESTPDEIETQSQAYSTVQNVTASENAAGDSSEENADETAAASSDDAAVAELPNGSPEIRLTTHTVTIPVGGTFSYSNYIASMKDDKDDSATLSGHIELVGDTVDTSKAGTYKVIYVIRDSDGNISNEPTLTVTVQ